MKYYVIAGEASGDLHGSNLLKALKQEDPQADFRVWGGELMQQAGGELVKHYKDLAFMGFAEVIMNLRTILRNIKFCKQDILAYQPDVIIFIDYPGFNMRIAKWAKELGIKTFYYISPQIWAWKENRIKAIRRDVDEMFVILPFEKDFYEKKHQFPVHFVGHPLLDAIENHPVVDPATFRNNYKLDQRPIIALLPGSRKQEITKKLEVMLSLIPKYPQFQFVVAGAPGQPESFYQDLLKRKPVQVISGATYSLLQNAHAAIVTSGTATLETALFNVPEVVCYIGNSISYQIAKRIITLKYISLVNLIMDREVVTELIQEQCNATRLQSEFEKIIQGETREKILKDYDELRKKLGGSGASKTAAKAMLEALKSAKK